MIEPPKPVFPSGEAPTAAKAPTGRTPVGDVAIHFQSKWLPKGVRGLPMSSSSATDARYEADVRVTGGLSGSFRGSIYPDDLNQRGHLIDGTYGVWLGWHGEGSPNQNSLRAASNGLRPVLVVERGTPVSVSSNAIIKIRSDGIHIHNGYLGWREQNPMSTGCLLVHPSDWNSFIGLFLSAFPDLDDWGPKDSRGAHARVGKRVGSVTVSSVFVPTPVSPTSLPRDQRGVGP